MRKFNYKYQNISISVHYSIVTRLINVKLSLQNINCKSNCKIEIFATTNCELHIHKI